MQFNIQSLSSKDEVIALRSVYEGYLKNIYWSENEMISILTGLFDEVRSNEIVNILHQHLDTKHAHIRSLQTIFKSIGIEAEMKQFHSIKCLSDEISATTRDMKRGIVRDAAYIVSMQHIVHSQIATYGTLKAFAITLKEEEEEIVDVFDVNLMDEKLFDLNLSNIAESYVNDEAANKEY